MTHGNLSLIVGSARGVPVTHSNKTPTKEANTVNIRPLHDRVVVQRSDAQEEVRGGIIIPDTAKEKPQEAVVKAVGPGKLQDNGERSPIDVKEGDRILIGKYSGNEIKIDGEDFVILREDEILAVIEG